MTEDRFAKVQTLLERTNRLCDAWSAEHGASASPEKLQEFWDKVGAFSDALTLYLQVEIPWDSQLINATGRVENVAFKTKAPSCQDSVMDRARDLFVFASTRALDTTVHT